MTLQLLAGALGCFTVGLAFGILALVWPAARVLSAASAAVGSAALVALAAFSLGGGGEAFTLPASTPIGGFEVRTAALPGVFLLLTGLVGTAISVYSTGYAAQIGGPPRQAAFFALLSPTLAALTLILVAGNALTFLVAWEGMSILTYVLVALEFEHIEAPRAAFLMLALSELGFLAIVVGFALIGGFGGADFAQLGGLTRGAERDAAFVLFLFGFGAKAGLLPLQGWLPEAHPAAPSNVSSLLSAVVVKMAIFGLVLTCLQLLAAPPAWWGYVALIAGVVTAIYGILFSLLAFDLKRALAFSTVENLGFIVCLIGAALVFRASGRPMLVALALTAALLHALYHAVLKGGLFLGAGSVQTATGTRDMDALGGLSHRMRWTAAAFFLVAMGLAGVPPMNGFQSEWLGLQALLQSHLLTAPGTRVLLATSGAVLALAFALAVTTYVRIVGGVFLGAARSRAAERAEEPAPSMAVGLWLLAGVAVVFGLLPPLGIGAAATAASEATGTPGVLDAVLPPIFLHPERFATPVKLGATFLDRVVPANGLVVVPANADFASISPTYIFLSMAAVIALVAVGLRTLRPPPLRRTDVWAGAIPEYRPAMQYTATGFTNPLRFIFGTVYRSAREIEGDYYQAPFFARTIRYTHRFIEPVETFVYDPAVRTARLLSERMGPLQAGNVSLYLLYLFLAFLIVLFIH